MSSANQDTFFAENAKKDGVKATASGLQYKVLRPSTAGKTRPSKANTVKVHYRGTLISGKEFDSSYGRGSPSEFGVSQVIPGWTEALQLMLPGDIWEVYIPSKLAYGDRAIAGLIPANSALIFKVHLLGIKGGEQASESDAKDL